MSGSSRDRETRINLSINRLISHLIPDDPRLNEEQLQTRHDDYYQTVEEAFKSHDQPEPAEDVNYAHELIKRKLFQQEPQNPNLVSKFSSLYARLLSLPVLNQKWAILFLLYSLADSHDPEELNPEAAEEFIQEREQQRLEELRAKQESQSTARPKARRPPPKPEDVAASDSGDELLENALSKGLRNVVGPARGPPADGESSRPSTRAESAHHFSIVEEKRKVKAMPERDVSIKSKLLADNFSAYEPSELILLRDLPYTLQGLSSETLPFGKGYSLRLPATLPPPLISLLHTLAEPSLLYRTLEDFVKTPAKGLLGQSLRAAVSNELRSYLTLVATLEGQIRRALSSLEEGVPRSGIGKAGVTLKRCVVWTREATMGLRLLSLIAEESKNKKGGQLISLIHSFASSHGDPIVGAFAERLLTPVTKPFYDILRHWIYDGELSDPYAEFFVREQSPDAMPPGKSGSVNVWEDKYLVASDMIPSIITVDFAQKIFLIGKSLNFIRHSCGDAQWVESYSKESSKSLHYGDTATLESWIDDAYKATMRRLLHLMTSKFHLLDHLQALKDYILLGQGDFIALLMESLATNLDRPAGVQYRHTLTAQLEHAIRGSNAQHDNPEVLRRLDARMLQLSHGDIGWDCFTLEYKIDAPVDVVVSDWGAKQYLKVFNFLWSIKRVEFALSSTWRRVTTGYRGVLQTRHAVVAQTWKTTRGHLAEMVHFVGQLQYYILFEVIESSWTELQTRLKHPDITLDDMISAHTKYLNSITHKGLLGARRRRHATQEGEDENSYMIQLSELLRTMRSYRDCVDGLYSWSVSDFTRRQEADLLSTAGGARGAAARMQAAANIEDDEDAEGGAGPSGAQSEFPALQERLRHLGERFQSKLQVLLGDLAYQPDIDLRFLGVAMNFNDVYQPVRRKAKTAPAGGASGAGSGAEKSKR